MHLIQLAEREHEIVGRPGMTYHCPLAQWLSELSGHTYGVDGRLYGGPRALITAGDSCRAGRRSLSPGPRCWPFVLLPAAKRSSYWRALNWRCALPAPDELPVEVLKENVP